MKLFSILMLTTLFTAISTLGAVQITPQNENIRYSGVIEKINGSSGMELYRLKKSYIDATWAVSQGAWAGKNAGTQPGITIQVKTSSPTVTFKFALNSSYEDRWSRMVLYRNGAEVKTAQAAAGSPISSISATTNDGTESVWTCVLPAFKAHIFTGVELDDGHYLTAFDHDSRPVYISIGNSITHGVGQTANAGNLSYPWIVSQDLHYQLFNFGVGGSRINTQVLENLEGHNPELITVLWGYNDVVYGSDDLSLAIERYDSLMTSLLTTYPESKVMAIELTFTTSSVGKNTANTIERFRTEQKTVLDSLQGLYSNLIVIAGLDYTNESSLSDAVHLNDNGAASLATGILESLGNTTEESPHIYVGTSGTDGAGFGTESKPFQTIAYAMNQAVPGDTVFVLPGTYTNAGFGNGDKNNGNIAYITDVHGEPGKEIVLMSSEPLRAKLKFDGSGALIFSHVSHLIIDGFEIEGPGASIDTTDAISHRLDNPVLSYYSGRGIAFWGKDGNHHITIKNNSVHHCPNSGIRANYVDYITIENNDVYSNCWWSPNAESGIVIAQATNINNVDSAKIILRSNRVWNNGNYVIYYNPTYGDGDGYGQPGYTEIVDGQGLYITRSNDTYLAGEFLIENNLSVNNGINGIGFHHSNHGIIRNNTVYKNGQYPERPVSGITINGADDVLVYNNISVGRNDVVLQNYEGSTNVSLYNNLVWDGTNSFDSGSVTSDPLFVNPGLNPLTADFSLQEISPAFDAGTTPVSDDDILRNKRVSGDGVDIGAYELIVDETSVYSTALRKSESFQVVSTEKGIRLTVRTPSQISLFSLKGQLIAKATVHSEITLGNSLSPGIYLIRIQQGKTIQSLKFLKK